MHFVAYIDLVNRFLVKFHLNDNSLIERYERGVEAIKKTEIDIEVLKQDIEELSIQLDKLSQQNQVLIDELRVRQVEADQKKFICEQEEQETAMQKKFADSLKNECETELNRVIPIFKQAADALEKI
jgi:dynein heavy chain, axonemal